VLIFGLEETGHGITEVVGMCNKMDIGPHHEEEEHIRRGVGTEGARDRSGSVVIGINFNKTSIEDNVFFKRIPCDLRDNKEHI